MVRARTLPWTEGALQQEPLFPHPCRVWCQEREGRAGQRQQSSNLHHNKVVIQHQTTHLNQLPQNDAKRIHIRFLCEGLFGEDFGSCPTRSARDLAWRSTSVGFRYCTEVIIQPFMLCLISHESPKSISFTFTFSRTSSEHTCKWGNRWYSERSSTHFRAVNIPKHSSSWDRDARYYVHANISFQKLYSGPYWELAAIRALWDTPSCYTTAQNRPVGTKQEQEQKSERTWRNRNKSPSFMYSISINMLSSWVYDPKYFIMYLLFTALNWKRKKRKKKKKKEMSPRALEAMTRQQAHLNIFTSDWNASSSPTKNCFTATSLDLNYQIPHHSQSQDLSYIWSILHG